MARKRIARHQGLKLQDRNGVWQITGTLRGKTFRQSTGLRDRNLAEAVRIQLEQEVLNRSVYGARAVAAFEDGVDVYIKNGGEARFLKPLREFFAGFKLNDIKQTEVQAFVQKYYPTGKASYVNRVAFTPLIAIIRAAAEAELCEMPRLKRPKQVKSKTKPAPDGWMRWFVGACSNPKLKAIVLFITTTGARIQEACDLQWSEVDWEGRHATLLDTKNGEARVVPLTETVLEALIPLRREAGKVFGYAGRGSVRTVLERLCEAHGMPYYSSHKIGRHAMATRLGKAGHSTKVIQEAGGWKTARLVLDTYGHMDRTQVDDAMRGVDDGFKASPSNVVSITKKATG